MCWRNLRLLLLVWFPGLLHAQTTSQHCRAPSLNSGYFIPVQETYSEEMQITYACVDEFKPAAEEWWATSSCQNGKWSPEPQCVDEKVCFPPTIPNGKYTENQNGWYEDRAIIRIRCDKGYKDMDATAVCMNTTWSSLPVCEKSTDACGEPPEIPHAVIIHQGYQELFAPHSELQYECEDGYRFLDEADNSKSIYCRAGNWTEAPTCRPSSSSGSNEREIEPQVTATASCSVDTQLYPELVHVSVKHIKHGEADRLDCVRRSGWKMDRYAVARCTNGRLSLSRCIIGSS